MQSGHNIRDFKFWFADLLVFSLSFLLSYAILFGFNVNASALADYRETFLGILVFHSLAALVMHPYADMSKRGYLKEAKAVFIHVLIVFLVLITYIFALHVSHSVSRLLLFLFLIISMALIYAERIIFKKLLRIYNQKTNNYISALLVTVPEFAKNAVSEIDSLYGYFLRGIIDYSSQNTGNSLCGVNVVSGKNGALDYIKSHWVDEIFVYLPGSDKLDASFVNSCKEMGIKMKLASPNPDSFTYPIKTVETVGDTMYIVGSVTDPDPSRLVVKRIIDIIGGLVGIILTCILTVFIAPIIYIQSPGPIFFRQTRVGKNGKKFKIIKFRTMYNDAEARKAELMEQNKMSGFMFKIDNDPRIFPFGRLLRKLSIDEFPQFFNVFLGQMSLVGTRPPTVDEYMQYDYHHKARLAMKPGLTGMWQASGRSEITDFEKVVEMDVSYIENWCLSLDIKILFKTIGAVLTARGSE